MPPSKLNLAGINKKKYQENERTIQKGHVRSQVSRQNNQIKSRFKNKKQYLEVRSPKMIVRKLFENKKQRKIPRVFPEYRVVDSRCPQVLFWTQIKLPFNPGTAPDIIW